ncbi:uncharacterized protein M6G45_016228 isoform 1-T1 [Spheniscus humboldti]
MRKKRVQFLPPNLAAAPSARRSRAGQSGAEDGSGFQARDETAKPGDKTREGNKTCLKPTVGEEICFFPTREAERGNTQGRFEGRRLRPAPPPTSGRRFLLAGRKARLRQTARNLRAETGHDVAAVTSRRRRGEKKTPRGGQAGAGDDGRGAAAGCGRKAFWGTRRDLRGENPVSPAIPKEVLAEFLDWRASEEKRRLDYLETSEAERRRIGAEFERLRRVLAEKERAVLGRLAELDAAFETAQAEKSLRVAEGIAGLHGLIGQLEAKPLPQDIGSILSSWSEPRLHLPSGLPAELEKSLSSCRRQRAALREALEEFRGMGRPETKPGTRNCPSTEEKAKAPPEPGTAPLPQLLADRKSVRWDEEERDGAGEPRRGQEPATPGRCRTRTR